MFEKGNSNSFRPTDKAWSGDVFSIFNFSGTIHKKATEENTLFGTVHYVVQNGDEDDDDEGLTLEKSAFESLYGG